MKITASYHPPAPAPLKEVTLVLTPEETATLRCIAFFTGAIPEAIAAKDKAIDINKVRELLANLYNKLTGVV